MSTPTPTHRDKVLNDGIHELSAWLACEVRDHLGSEGELFDALKERVNNLHCTAREATAKDVHQSETLIRCPFCLGNGGMGYEAGDHSGWDDCETCDATGYLPASFEPRPILADSLISEVHFSSWDNLPLEDERPEEAK